ncbi:flagellar biosynthesis protein FlhB [Phycisphaera mikurensis]|uniref:Flagellar biosynthetic protein FlhB n=1 Tax=Phycisphaera mikurensis (strain NBRC 102666 / KCTC 22515 / FYK2301M01) TaxID=1142394 RepID=I0IGQ6_PHYMF|nr:flagellar biosynthesis protein FlhB [Phycisphaera mikurensis]MBB6443234.1 flagellar biosynthetic protein FlhB [Phycisphaera mikurensis]BAM04444.1 flagellar biosynthetic protein FlhB [Phycisphaera mikurensis NBRC 102666]
MADTPKEDKTEAPSAKRLAKAREDGNVARSTDLSAAVGLLVAMLMLFFLSDRLVLSFRHAMELFLGHATAANPTRVDQAGETVAAAIDLLGRAMLPVLGVMVLASLVGSLGQTGFLLTGKPLQPKPSKLNPLAGAKRLVDPRAMGRLAQSLAKLGLLGALGYFYIWDHLPQLVKLAELEPVVGLPLAGWMIFELAIILAVLLMVLGFADYAWQKHQHRNDLKMTKQEVKQESKDMSGDPEIRGRRLRIARQLAMQRVSQAVPQADLVITNPTHLAVALKYDSATMAAPVVLAKGADVMAMQIRRLATLSGIPLIERKPLARALYAEVDVNGEVPVEHYAAVAELLAYVYRLEGRAA